jgi:hypothetical protein
MEQHTLNFVLHRGRRPGMKFQTSKILRKSIDETSPQPAAGDIFRKPSTSNPGAESTRQLCNQVIHLAAGLQFPGFKSVVSTLWEVDDSVAKHVVEVFYKYMSLPKEEGVMDCTKAAWALNCATHAVKTKVPLEQRMVFVHIGV